MKAWVRLLLCGLVGAAIGAGGAVSSVRSASLGMQTMIGPWATGRDFGSAEASPYIRAVVALRGLLALPATEARYYTAITDDTGAPLEGRCSYRVEGGALPARWWSLTLYDPAGYLVENKPNIYSVGSVSLPLPELARWKLAIAPGQQPGHWLPTGGIDRFHLTLRAYLPADRGRTDFTAQQLPRITKGGCA